MDSVLKKSTTRVQTEDCLCQKCSSSIDTLVIGLCGVDLFGEWHGFMPQKAGHCELVWESLSEDWSGWT